MRVTIIDYGVGNLHSLAKALVSPGVSVAVEPDPARAIQADALILPGVGAFGSAAERLAGRGDEIRQAIADGLPTLGICLGMQLLFDGSDEGEGRGLGVIPGHVRKLSAQRVPQIGWNGIDGPRDPLLARSRLATAYYANSFVCRADDDAVVTAWSTHEGDRFPAVVRSGSAVGVQFHPEKSSSAGVAFLRAFLDEATR